ncbi:hypothetical protein ACXO75_07280, partial [Lactobacillus delbrueckii subsp. bulgaricus]
ASGIFFKEKGKTKGRKKEAEKKGKISPADGRQAFCMVQCFKVKEYDNSTRTQFGATLRGCSYIQQGKLFN